MNTDSANSISYPFHHAFFTISYENPIHKNIPVEHKSMHGLWTIFISLHFNSTFYKLLLILAFDIPFTMHSLPQFHLKTPYKKTSLFITILFMDYEQYLFPSILIEESTTAKNHRKRLKKHLKNLPVLFRLVSAFNKLALFSSLLVSCHLSLQISTGTLSCWCIGSPLIIAARPLGAFTFVSFIDPSLHFISPLDSLSANFFPQSGPKQPASI